jgi:hypothetical protein
MLDLIIVTLAYWPFIWLPCAAIVLVAVITAQQLP